MMRSKKDLTKQIDRMINYLERKRDIFDFDQEAIEDSLRVLRFEKNEIVEKAKMNFEEWIEKARYPEYWKEEGKEHHFNKRVEWIEKAINLEKTTLALKQLVGADEYDYDRTENHLRDLQMIKECIERQKDRWVEQEDISPSSPSQTSAGGDE